MVRYQTSTVFAPGEIDVPVMISQPLAVRNEQTGQPVAGNPLELEVVVDRGVSGPARCDKARRFELLDCFKGLQSRCDTIL